MLVGHIKGRQDIPETIDLGPEKKVVMKEPVQL